MRREEGKTMRRSVSVRLLVTGMVVFAIWQFGSAKAAAQCDVDQANIALPTFNLAAVFTGQQFGQTFTVGANGVLCTVAMYVDKRGTPAADLVVEVQGVSGGFPDGIVLATASLSPAAVTDGLNS